MLLIIWPLECGMTIHDLWMNSPISPQEGIWILTKVLPKHFCVESTMISISSMCVLANIFCKAQYLSHLSPSQPAYVVAARNGGSGFIQKWHSTPDNYPLYANIDRGVAMDRENMYIPFTFPLWTIFMYSYCYSFWIFHVRVPYFQIRCRYLSTWEGTLIVVPAERDHLY